MTGFLILRIEPVSHKSKKSWIRFDGAEDLCLYRSEVYKLGWSEGMLVPKSEYDRLVRQVLLPRAKSRALHLLEKQDRTSADLADKLSSGGYPQEAVEEAVAYAASYHYIDDERYARNYVRYHKAGRSRRKVAMELRNKGVDRELIEQALAEEYDTDERTLILALLDKRHYDAEQADYQERSRMYRYLASRGFDSDAIREVI